jgi:glycosyltransferase involved in cell wall biosynthesis
MKKPSVAILHYTCAPIVGGVEAVMQAHIRLFLQNDYQVSVLTGRGERDALPHGCGFTLVPQIDTLSPEIARMTAELNTGSIPLNFNRMVETLIASLVPLVAEADHLIIHNIMTKHFNLPLTAALVRLIEAGTIRHPIAWCHDFTWTSENSRMKVHPGFPWDFLRTKLSGVDYVTVSQRRRDELATLFGCQPEEIFRVYNGIDPANVLGLSQQGLRLARRLGLPESDLILLMPVRVTQAKNIEYAMHVMASLKKQTNNPRLVVTGPPDPHDPSNLAYYQTLLELRSNLDLTNETRFVYESGPDADQPLIISESLVGELLRQSDLVFMPSHREGFAMPVLEAGLAGIPVLTTNVPAADEIGEKDVEIFSLETPPEKLAEDILDLVQINPVSRFRRRLRLNYSWESIFHKSIESLLNS